MIDKKIMASENTNSPYRSLIVQRKKSQSSFLGRWLPRFFHEEASPETKLAGRIHRQLQQDAHQVIKHLKQLRDTLRDELEGHENKHLWTSFEGLINPLLREYEQLERRLQEDPHPVTLQSYTTWIEKAKLWATLSARPHDRENLTKIVVEHTQKLSDAIIDRDLKMLEEYGVHELYHLGLSLEEVTKIVNQIQDKIAPHVQGLLSLKLQKPSDLGISTLQAWKSQINHERSHHYNAALHLIDAKIQEIAPKTTVEKSEDEEN